MIAKPIYTRLRTKHNWTTCNLSTLPQLRIKFLSWPLLLKFGLWMCQQIASTLEWSKLIF